MKCQSIRTIYAGPSALKQVASQLGQQVLDILEPFQGDINVRSTAWNTKLITTFGWHESCWTSKSEGSSFAKFTQIMFDMFEEPCGYDAILCYSVLQWFGNSQFCCWGRGVWQEQRVQGAFNCQTIKSSCAPMAFESWLRDEPWWGLVGDFHDFFIANVLYRSWWFKPDLFHLLDSFLVVINQYHSCTPSDLAKDALKLMHSVF